MYTKIKRIDRNLCTPLLQIICEIVALFRVSIASTRKLRVPLMFPVALGKTHRAYLQTVALILKVTQSALLDAPRRGIVYQAACLNSPLISSGIKLRKLFAISLP